MNPKKDPIAIEEEEASKSKGAGWLVTPGVVVCTIRCVICFAMVSQLNVCGEEVGFSGWVCRVSESPLVLRLWRWLSARGDREPYAQGGNGCDVGKSTWRYGCVRVGRVTGF